MKKKIIRSLLLTFSVLSLSQNCFCGGYVSNLAIKKNASSITMTDYSLSTSSINDVYQNSYSNILYVYASSLESINSLSIEVHYSSNNIEISSINNSVASLMYDSSIQSDTAKITYLFDATTGTSEKTTLFSFYFSVNETASIGGDYFDILVTEAYDSTLNSVEFKNVRTSFNIKEKQQTRECNIYSQLAGNKAKINETVSVNYYTYDYDIESASFVVTYDDELLSFESIDKGSYLDDKIVDINSSYKGSIYLSFVSSSISLSSDLFTMKFKVIKNTTTTTKIQLTPSELYDSNLNIVSSSKVTNTLNIVEDENYVADKPSIKLSSSLNSSKQVSLKVSLEENMHLGAGDFVISFDKENLTYVSSNKLFSPSFFNINEKELSDGVLKFSIINLTDIVDALDVLEVIFTPKLFCEQSYQISFDITGSGVADSLTNSIVINYINFSQTIAATGHSFGDWIIDAEATKNSEGKMHRVCKTCGYEEFQSIEKLDGFNKTHLILAISLPAVVIAGSASMLLIVRRKRKNK